VEFLLYQEHRHRSFYSENDAILHLQHQHGFCSLRKIGPQLQKLARLPHSDQHLSLDYFTLPLTQLQISDQLTAADLSHRLVDLGREKIQLHVAQYLNYPSAKLLPIQILAPCSFFLRFGSSTSFQVEIGYFRQAEWPGLLKFLPSKLQPLLEEVILLESLLHRSCSRRLLGFQ